MAGSELLLIRHGESEWNAVRRWQGIADVELTDRGREQARQAAALLAHEFADRAPLAVWSSTLSRANETARVIAAAFGVDDVGVDGRLVEADAGPWQGLTPDEIDAGWPGARANGERPDGFETRPAVVARVFAALADIGAATGSEPAALTIVVTHSGVIRTVVGEHGIVDIALPNLAGWFVTVDGDDVRLGEPFDPGDIDVDRRSARTTLG